jgi:catechol 2,3-dioxygenase-like lactoylglutathione lyase family enzyme
MECRLEVVVVPVSDVEKAREFYVDKLGFRLDTDHQAGESFRVIQVTPPGSACSIVFGRGMGDGKPGSVKGTHLVVKDIVAAHAELEAASVENSGPVHFAEGGVMTPGPHPEGADYGSFVFFADPDGNSWALQQIVSPAR